MESILQDKRECLICKDIYNLHVHHVFEGPGRKKICDREGLIIFLCPHHHNASNNSVHLNEDLNKRVKRWSQKKWMEHNKKTKDDFIKMMGKNYLID